MHVQEVLLLRVSFFYLDLGRFNAIYIKSPANYFVDIKLIPEFICRGKRPKIINIILKNKTGELTLPNLKTNYRATGINTAWYWQNNRQKGQWNRVDFSEIDSYKYAQVTFTKVKVQLNGENMAFSNAAKIIGQKK